MNERAEPGQIGKYRIVGRVGRGGMGTVFRAHDPILGREVALKVISPDVEMTEDLRARFYREAQACAQLSHPNIVTIHDLGEDQGRLYIVMELVDGEELRRLIAARQPAALDARLALLAELADGLRYAHAKGIVHRDVKPANVLVTPDGHAKILDFGLARMGGEGGGVTRTGLVMGTLRYMSPEQARGKVDHRSDVFSLGAVAYELLVFRPPFPADDPLELLTQIKELDPPALSAVDPAIPDALDGVVRRALAKDPAARYADLGEMRADLLRVRQRLAEGADALLARVRAKLTEAARLRAALAAKGEPPEDVPTEILPDERTDSGRLAALERQLDAELARLRGRLGEPTAASAVVSSRARSRRLTGPVVGATVALVALGGGLFAWRPWERRDPAHEGSPPAASSTPDIAPGPSPGPDGTPRPAIPSSAATPAGASPGPGPLAAPPGSPPGQRPPPSAPPARSSSSPVTAETVPVPADRPTGNPGPGGDPGTPPPPRPLAALRPPTDVADPRALIREVVDGYKRAIETRDVPLMRQVRPGITPAEVQRLEHSFDANRSHVVELRIDEIEVTPPEALARGQRSDTMVSKDGRTFHNEAPVVFRLRRLVAGWVIVAIE